MSVLVKGMKMPAVCADCDFCIETEDDHKCSRTKESLGLFAFEMTRGMKCPLGYIPKKHGRLIDADTRVNVQMYDDEFEDFQTVNMSIDDLLDSSWIELEDDPTIIPAEEGGED